MEESEIDAATGSPAPAAVGAVIPFPEIRNSAGHRHVDQTVLGEEVGAGIPRIGAQGDGRWIHQGVDFEDDTVLGVTTDVPGDIGLPDPDRSGEVGGIVHKVEAGDAAVHGGIGGGGVVTIGSVLPSPDVGSKGHIHLFDVGEFVGCGLPVIGMEGEGRRRIGIIDNDGGCVRRGSAVAGVVRLSHQNRTDGIASFRQGEVTVTGCIGPGRAAVGAVLPCPEVGDKARNVNLTIGGNAVGLRLPAIVVQAEGRRGDGGVDGDSRTV